MNHSRNNGLTSSCKPLSSSPERYTFQRDKYIEQQTEKNLMDDPATIEMIEWYKTSAQEKKVREQDPEWQKNNLEYDLRTTDWILDKVRGCHYYAQWLYAALCNNDFIKNEPWTILKEETWACSWRYAGGIVANMRESGDYIEWYCSGQEGTVTDEVRTDLLRLGWIIKETNYGLE